MNEINIAVDVFSYGKNIWSVSDYSGEQIYSKLALPLFRHRNDVIKLLVVESFEQNNNSITLKIRNDLYWSNGEQVTADDYARAKNYIFNTEDNRYQKLLLYVIRHPVGVEVIDKHISSINTAWYDPFIINYLSLINFSPMHISGLNLHAGPYEIKRMSEEVCELEPNPFFRCEEDEDWAENINYILLTSDREACAFHQGDVHVSCDTSLDLNRYRQSLQNADFHEGSGTLVKMEMTLTAVKLLSEGDDCLDFALRSLVGQIVIVDCEELVGCSSPPFLGLIIIALKEKWKIYEYMENIIHEMSHVELYIKRLVDPLIIKGSYLKSPFRNEPWPVLGVYHAAFVLSRIIKYIEPFSSKSLHADFLKNRVPEWKLLLDETCHNFLIVKSSRQQGKNCSMK